MGSVFVTAAHMSISLRECIHMAHRFVQLSGHVRSEYALHGQSCSLLAPVTRLLNIHALVLLDDDCGPCATQELCKTENRKQCTWSGAFTTLNGWPRPLWLLSPAGLVSTDVSLDSCGSVFHSQVLLACQPAADCLLDADASSTQLVCTQFLQVRNLPRSEKDLGFPELVLIWILLENQKVKS